MRVHLGVKIQAMTAMHVKVDIKVIGDGIRYWIAMLRVYST
jgi:hypothetical protein